MSSRAEDDCIFIKSKLMTERLDGMIQKQEALDVKVGLVNDELNE